MRNREIKVQEDKIRGFEKRPIVVLKKRKQSLILNLWYAAAEGRRERRTRMQRGLLYLRNITMGKAWRTWMSFHNTCGRRRILTAKCIGRLRNVVAGHAWTSWWDLIAIKREKAAKVAIAAAHWSKMAQAKAWRAMRDDFLWRQEVKRMAKRWMNPLRAKALAGALPPSHTHTHTHTHTLRAALASRFPLRLWPSART